MNLNYGQYIKLEELLSLQEPKSVPAEHDEYLFIMIHQIYELWFKLILIEFNKLKSELRNDQLFDSFDTLKRNRTILKTIVAQLDILETMTPLSFSKFRSFLDTASGAQSIQFRAIEFTLGYKRPNILAKLSAYDRSLLEPYLETPSVRDELYSYLRRQGAEILSDHDADPDHTRQALLKIYQERKDIRILFELILDFDEGMQEWRYRHIKLAERTIGTKYGTGGTDGVEFLKTTLFKSFFPHLWGIRHLF